MTSTVLARIILRVLAGVLMGYGVASNDAISSVISDPDVATMFAALLDMLPGLVVWGASELWYWFAKRFGWST